jgi:hypothetical protein
MPYVPKTREHKMRMVGNDIIWRMVAALEYDKRVTEHTLRWRLSVGKIDSSNLAAIDKLVECGDVILHIDGKGRRSYTLTTRHPKAISGPRR